MKIRFEMAKQVVGDLLCCYGAIDCDPAQRLQGFANAWNHLSEQFISDYDREMPFMNFDDDRCSPLLTWIEKLTHSYKCMEAVVFDSTADQQFLLAVEAIHLLLHDYERFRTEPRF